MTENLRIETLLNFYFSHRGEYKKAAINRAYRDLNRTLLLKGEDQNSRDQRRRSTGEFILDSLSRLLNNKFAGQYEFDSYHEKVCDEIKCHWPKLTYGHIQKWVNMTLKYWLIIGEERIPGIKLNFEFFHIPIDSIILEKLFMEKYPEIPWSKIKDYPTYFKYQKRFREENSGKIPIIVETETFNDTARLLPNKIGNA